MSLYDPLTGTSDDAELPTVDERTYTLASELPSVHNPAPTFDAWPTRPSDDYCVAIAMPGARIRSGRHRAPEAPTPPWPPMLPLEELAVPWSLRIYHVLFGALIVGCLGMAVLEWKYPGLAYSINQGTQLNPLQWVFAAILSLIVWMFSRAMLRHLERCRG